MNCEILAQYIILSRRYRLAWLPYALMPSTRSYAGSMHRSAKTRDSSLSRSKTAHDFRALLVFSMVFHFPVLRLRGFCLCSWILSSEYGWPASYMVLFGGCIATLLLVSVMTFFTSWITLNFYVCRLLRWANKTLIVRRGVPMWFYLPEYIVDLIHFLMDINVYCMRTLFLVSPLRVT